MRTILLILAGVIAGANAFAALSPGFFSLLVASFIAGLPHGAFFGAGAIVCTRLAAKGEGAAAVAVMIGGMTVANVIGVPAATFVSNLLVWRYLFAIVALFGLLAFVASACLFGVGGPPQYLIVGFSKGGEMLGAAGIQIAFNVSNATSAAIGGLVINRGYGVESTALTGIPFALTGMVCFLLLYRKFRTQGA